MPHVILNPESLGAPKGYSNGVVAPAGARLVFVAGQVAWDRDQKIVATDFAAQFGRALENAVTVVRAAGGAPEHVVRLTIYVTSTGEYDAARKAVGAEYRRVMGRHYPAMALVQVAALLEHGAKVEIEATAAIPAAIPAGR